MTRSLFIVLLLCPLLYSCDPALRLEIINHSSVPQTLLVDSVTCEPLLYFLQRRRGLESRDTFTLQMGKDQKQVFYFGIGSWSEQSTVEMKVCLDSLFNIPAGEVVAPGQELRSTVKTHEWGNSLLTYKLFDLKPRR